MPLDPGPYNALPVESRTRWKGLCLTSACNKNFSPKIVDSDHYILQGNHPTRPVSITVKLGLDID